MDNTNEIMVSICCLVYNHEKYLREALDSFIMQKTNFKYEILIHDDASTDGSADIIREYEQKYPDIVKPIYQKENQYSKGVRISWEYQYPRAKGKYIALCEGDDFWCDENKLQIQFDAMEIDDKLSLCTHKVRCVKENGVSTEKIIPAKMVNNYLTSEEFIYLLTDIDKMYSFQTSSYFIRTKYLKEIIAEIPQFITVTPIGDMALMLYLATKGNLRYINNIMSCYRLNSISGWTRKLASSKKFAIEKRNKQILSIKLFDEFTKFIYTDRIKTIIRGYEFANHLEVHDYKKMKEYPEFWCMLNRKAHIYHYICHYIPFFQRIYRMFRK